MAHGGRRAAAAAEADDGITATWRGRARRGGEAAGTRPGSRSRTTSSRRGRWAALAVRAVRAVRCGAIDALSARRLIAGRELENAWERRAHVRAINRSGMGRRGPERRWTARGAAGRLPEYLLWEDGTSQHLRAWQPGATKHKYGPVRASAGGDEQGRARTGTDGHGRAVPSRRVRYIKPFCMNRTEIAPIPDRPTRPNAFAAAGRPRIWKASRSGRCRARARGSSQSAAARGSIAGRATGPCQPHTSRA